MPLGLAAALASAASPTASSAGTSGAPTTAASVTPQLPPAPPDLSLFERLRAAPPASPPLPAQPHVDLPGVNVTGIPPVALRAYTLAARALDARQPGCHLPWNLLAGIGMVESDHARGGGSTNPHWNGISRPPILGPLLDGNGFAAISDTDHGVYDGSTVWDRAVGPMQFLPSTWMAYGADGDADGVRNPQDIYDATVAAGDYLCAGGRDLSTPQGMQLAVFSYNHSFDYVKLVLVIAARYAGLSPDAYGQAALPTDSAAGWSPGSERSGPSSQPTPRATPSPSASGPAGSGGSSPSGTAGPSGGTRSSAPAPAATATPATPLPAPTGVPVPGLPLPSTLPGVLDKIGSVPVPTPTSTPSLPDILYLPTNVGL